MLKIHYRNSFAKFSDIQNKVKKLTIETLLWNLIVHIIKVKKYLKTDHQNFFVKSSDKKIKINNKTNNQNSFTKSSDI